MTKLGGVPLLLFVQLFCNSCNRPTHFPVALAFGTDGYVDTDFDLATISNRPHSITFRFMVQYPNSYWNDILGESIAGSYSVLKDNVPPALGTFIGGAGEAYPILQRFPPPIASGCAVTLMVVFFCARPVKTVSNCPAHLGPREYCALDAGIMA
jgi:hypothetical protein